MTLQENLLAELSHKTFKLAHWIFWFASWNKCVPFELTGTTDLRVKIFEKKWKLFCWYGANWIFTFAFFFQWISLIFQAMTKSFTSGMAIHMFYVVAISFGFVYMRAMYLKPREAIFMLNQQDFILKSLKGKKQLHMHYYETLLNLCVFTYRPWTS